MYQINTDWSSTEYRYNRIIIENLYELNSTQKHENQSEIWKKIKSRLSAF